MYAEEHIKIIIKCQRELLKQEVEKGITEELIDLVCDTTQSRLMTVIKEVQKNE